MNKIKPINAVIYVKDKKGKLICVNERIGELMEKEDLRKRKGR